MAVLDISLTTDEGYILLDLLQKRMSQEDKNTKAGQLALAPLIPIKEKLEAGLRQAETFRIAAETKREYGD